MVLSILFAKGTARICADGAEDFTPLMHRR